MPLDLLNRHILTISSFQESKVLPRAHNDLKALFFSELSIDVVNQICTLQLSHFFQ
ncbi:Uncharacterised protein [Legionella taurinensis]|nr:Uncharacterised protein [Legionella taurinensis]STY64938.1 Uncharacterised protein [Legionella taurinensis]